MSNNFIRFCDAMILIRREAEDIITGKQPKDNNVLKNAPHPVSVIVGEWDRYAPNVCGPNRVLIHFFSPYSREAAVYPAPWLRSKKFWPSVSRVDDGA